MRRLSQQFMVMVAALLVVMFVAVPLLWMLSTSIKEASDILRYPPTVIPTKVTLENYYNLFTNTAFPRYLLNSVLVGLSVVVLTNSAALLGAYSVTRFRFAGRRALILSSLFGYMVAPIMIVIPFYMVMRACGIGNTHLALILAHTAFCLPFALWLLKSYFESVPIDLEKAARVDGASQLQVFLQVALPLAAPGVAAVSIFVFILSWNDYIFARILIASDRLKTIPVGVEDIYNATVVDWGVLMAAGTVITVPVLLGFVVINKVMMKRLGFSGLKT